MRIQYICKKTTYLTPFFPHKTITVLPKKTTFIQTKHAQ